MAHESTVEDLDPVDGFLAALRRHLGEPSGDDPVGASGLVEGQEAAANPTDLANPTDQTPAAAPADAASAAATPGAEGGAVEVEVEVEVEVVQTAAMRPSDASPPGPDTGHAALLSVTPGSEHGDRRRFLARARQRLAAGIPANPVHPLPPPPLPQPQPLGDDEGVPAAAVPEPTYGNLDPGDLPGTFARAVEEAGGVCHRVEGEVPDTLLDHLVAELSAWDVVVSAEPEAVALAERLTGRGVEVTRATPDAAARATVGVTSPVAAIAATGSVVLDSRRAGGRLASLLPTVHLCVVPVDRLVATPGDLLRTLGADPAALPPALVLETGPARTGDIEQVLALGDHGPTRLHVVLVE